MQHTTNYNLDMPEGNEQLSVMVNYNGNLQKIDAAIKGAEDKADADSAEIDDLSATVGVLESNVTAVNTRLTSVEADVTTVDGKADNALAGLQEKQNTVTGAASTITSTNLTTNRALVSDASGKVNISNVTSTELGRLSGVTSNVQTQINSKATRTWTHAATLNATTEGQMYTNASLANADEILMIVELDGMMGHFVLIPYHLYSLQDIHNIILDDHREVWNAVNIGLKSNYSFQYYKSDATTVSVTIELYYR